MSLERIKVDHVSKEIKGVTVIDNISMGLSKGKIYGIRGVNGSGKTMLMRLLCGLIRPTKGRVFYDGRILGKELAFPPSIGVLLEGPAFLDGYSGYSNLKMIADIKGIIGEKEIRETLSKVGLDSQDKKKYKKYSLGMKQRLGIAAAIMEEPEVILLDEPFNALDETGIEIIDGLIREQRSRGALVVLACHDTRHLEQLADEMTELSGGRIVG
ncbi:MAG: ATP-binding cassette domain-containing protein [Eubacteriales bacterium]|nr:ATP-binding cassette domain-containing protein [Eubacteriales bacterium]